MNVIYQYLLLLFGYTLSFPAALYASLQANEPTKDKPFVEQVSRKQLQVIVAHWACISGVTSPRKGLNNHWFTGLTTVVEQKALGRYPLLEEDWKNFYVAQRSYNAKRKKYCSTLFRYALRTHNQDVGHVMQGTMDGIPSSAGSGINHLQLVKQQEEQKVAAREMEEAGKLLKTLCEVYCNSFWNQLSPHKSSPKAYTEVSQTTLNRHATLPYPKYGTHQNQPLDRTLPQEHERYKQALQEILKKHFCCNQDYLKYPRWFRDFDKLDIDIRLARHVSLQAPKGKEMDLSPPLL